MAGKRPFASLGLTLGIAFFLMLLFMFLFELVKEMVSPSLTRWESHTVTILFTSIVAVFILYCPLRSAYREHQNALDALRCQKHAEENLRKSEIQYRSFVESVEDSIYTVDPESRYLLINTRHLARRGLSPDAYAGKPYGDFHTPEETEVFTSQVQRVLDTQGPVADEYAQNDRHFLRKLNPVIDPATGSVIAVTVISSDITERKNAERILAATNRKLNLVNDITRHDILNQLVALGSYLSLAGMHEKDPAVRSFILKGEQVIDTIHAQILFARNYQKIGVESPQWQNIGHAIRNVRMPAKLASLAIDPRCSQTEIYADPLLEKVFYNLLENAVRHAGPEPEIRISLRNADNTLRILCEDNGPGVPVENKEKIFERGFGSNTGFGLFLIREILAITDIMIHETGEPGRGCRFEITVPSVRYRTGTGTPGERPGREGPE